MRMVTGSPDYDTVINGALRSSACALQAQS